MSNHTVGNASFFHTFHMKGNVFLKYLLFTYSFITYFIKQDMPTKDTNMNLISQLPFFFHLHIFIFNNIISPFFSWFHSIYTFLRHTNIWITFLVQCTFLRCTFTFQNSINIQPCNSDIPACTDFSFFQKRGFCQLHSF